eukprot:TRINITY_DN7268_c0_g2_i1.p1 TRINITY_DN7268_c0_g2~~TRINITY_DN7268_c0_g2_i1.p1  ORF type:complete len:897 (-),score=240.79 TRINITY_DN7268_c0_g2_i1:88-2778(-)
MGKPDKLFHQVIYSTVKNGQPTIEESYPQNQQYAKNIAEFCFPDISTLKPSLDDTFLFVLTSQSQDKLFGFCKRFTINTTPYCICVISDFPWHNIHNEVLLLFEKKLKMYNGQFFPLIEDIDEISSIELPPPSSTINFKSLKYEFKRPSYTLSEAPLGKPSYATLCSSLSASVIFDTLSAILSERRIIFVGSNLTRLTTVICSILTLIYPFRWQFVFVPVLPNSLLTYATAPMPFIIGVLSSQLAEVKKLPLEEIVFVHIDENRCEINDEFRVIPEKYLQPFRYAIEKASLNMVSPSQQDESIKKSSTDLLVNLVGHYLWFMKLSQEPPSTTTTSTTTTTTSSKTPTSTPNKQSNSGNRVLFDRSLLIKTQKNPDLKRFLEVFSETQIFEEFVLERQNLIESKQPLLISPFDIEAQRIIKETQPPSVEDDDTQNVNNTNNNSMTGVTGAVNSYVQSFGQRFKQFQQKLETQTQKKKEPNSITLINEIVIDHISQNYDLSRYQYKDEDFSSSSEEDETDRQHDGDINLLYTPATKSMLNSISNKNNDNNVTSSPDSISIPTTPVTPSTPSSSHYEKRVVVTPSNQYGSYRPPPLSGLVSQQASTTNQPKQPHSTYVPPSLPQSYVPPPIQSAPPRGVFNSSQPLYKPTPTPPAPTPVSPSIFDLGLSSSTSTATNNNINTNNNSNNTRKNPFDTPPLARVSFDLFHSNDHDTNHDHLPSTSSTSSLNPPSSPLGPSLVGLKSTLNSQLPPPPPPPSFGSSMNNSSFEATSANTYSNPFFGSTPASSASSVSSSIFNQPTSTRTIATSSSSSLFNQPPISTSSYPYVLPTPLPNFSSLSISSTIPQNNIYSSNNLPSTTMPNPYLVNPYNLQPTSSSSLSSIPSNSFNSYPQHKNPFS